MTASRCWSWRPAASVSKVFRQWRRKSLKIKIPPLLVTADRPASPAPPSLASSLSANTVLSACSLPGCWWTLSAMSCKEYSDLHSTQTRKLSTLTHPIIICLSCCHGYRLTTVNALRFVWPAPPGRLFFFFILLLSGTALK